MSSFPQIVREKSQMTALRRAVTGVYGLKSLLILGSLGKSTEDQPKT